MIDQGRTTFLRTRELNPATREAFTVPVLRSVEGKKLRQGPQLPFLDDFSADDVSLSMKDHRQQYCDLKFVKPVRNHSKSF